MPLQPGAHVGPYDVIGSLGAGGMGEVYRARDTRLKREVALKILPESFAADPERLARFQREAELLASLNHPNIAGIHGLDDSSGVPALVLELVEGETLADRIVRGPVSFEDALRIAVQVADALEAAHEHGIVHRDLKPANIKLRPDGTVKVLDFGLAKLIQHTETAHGSSTLSSPTITSHDPVTGVGVLLGTAAYMSPEQAKGRGADVRSDIWAYGCVVFELVTGTRAFDGEGTSDTIAAVLRAEPDWTAIPAGTPRGFTRLLKRCLARDRRQRLHGIGDARLDLQELLSPEAPIVPVAIRPTLVGRVVALAAAAVVSGTVVGYGVWIYKTQPAPRTQRFTITLPDGDAYSNTGRHILAMSPAGTHVVYGAGNRLNLRAFDRLTSVPIPGTELGGRSPFFSPDGEWVGFWRDEQLMKVALSGGAPVKLCSAANPTGATWGEDGTILFGQATNGILRVSAEGGVPEVVVRVDGEASAHGPQLLPGGQWILFTLRPRETAWDDASILVQSTSSSERRVVMQGGRDARYLPTGHLVYSHLGTVFAIAFDVDSLRTTGRAVPLVEDVLDARTTTGASHFAHSTNGVLAYVGGWEDAPAGTPVWVARDGRASGGVTSTSLKAPEHPRLSPDGRRLALSVDGDVWVYDLDGRPPIRLTEGGGHFAPVWTPDGTRIIYETTAPETLMSVAADGGGGAPVRVTPGHFHPQALSPDGRVLIATDVKGGATGRDTDIVKVPLGDKFEPQPLVMTTNREGWDGVALSPDGRWMAYTTDATGQQELWVQPFAGPGARVRVSPNGGQEPVWSRSGKELYYLEGRKLMTVTIETRTRFDFEPPRFLFEVSYPIASQPPSYDVAPDGRFLMIKPDEDAMDVKPIVVVLNWFEELKRLVPVR